MKFDVRILADITLLSIILDDPDVAFDILGHNPRFIKQWAKQWRMLFNTDLLKLPTEIIFSTKTKPANHRPLSLMVL